MGDSAKLSDGRRVKVSRRLNRKSSGSAAGGSVCFCVSAPPSVFRGSTCATVPSAIELVRRWGVEGTRECFCIATGGCILLLEGVRTALDRSWSREAAVLRRDPRPSLGAVPLPMLDRSDECETDDRSLGFCISPPAALIRPRRPSREGDGRTELEPGLGIVEVVVGLGRPEAVEFGRETGSLERRGRPLGRF